MIRSQYLFLGLASFISASLNAVDITIESEFGQNEVSPAAGATYTVAAGSEVSFEAPEFVFLDENFDELAPTDSNIRNLATYRARCVGYSVDGTAIQGTERFFKITVNSNIRVVWQWEIENAVVIQSDAAIPGGDEFPSGFGNANPGFGKVFLPKSELFSAQVDGLVEPGAFVPSGASNIRYRLVGYRFENVPEPQGGKITEDDFHLSLSPGASIQKTRDVNSFNLETEDYTVEAWLKFPRLNFQRPGDADADNFQGSFVWGFNSTSSGFGGFIADPPPRIRVYFRFSLNQDDQLIVTAAREDASVSWWDIFLNVGEGTTFVSEELFRIPRQLATENWHHWALVLDSATDTIHLYRNGSRYDSKPMPGFVKSAAGVDQSDPFVNYDVFSYFSFTADDSTGNASGINNLRVWRQALPEAQIASFAQSSDPSDPADPAIPAPPPVPGPLFLESFDSAITGGSLSGTTEFLQFTNVLGQTREFFFDETPARAATDQIAVEDHMSLTWLWERQFRYEISVNEPQFAAQPFLRTTDLQGSTSRFDGTGQVWVPEGHAVELVSFYRTPDRCHTLQDFLKDPTGDFNGLSTTAMVDRLESRDLGGGNIEDQAARFYSVPSASAPSTVSFFFDRTIFRAEMALGETFPADDPDPLLVPDLCVGGELRATLQAPESGDVLRERSGGTGPKFEWDSLMRRVIPVQPGTFHIEWPDANDPTKSYLIEIVTDFSGETVPLPTAREQENGLREGTPGAYLFETTIDPVSESFPAAPLAHYDVLFSTGDDRHPPIALDPSETDPWAFQRMSFTESEGTVLAAENTFTAASEGRTVLLFSRREDSTQVANGDLDREFLVARVVQTHLVDGPIRRPAPAVRPSGALLLGGDREPLEILNILLSGQSDFLFPEDPRSLDFWLRVDALGEEDPFIVFNQSLPGSGLSFTIGIEPASHPDYPGFLFVDDGTRRLHGPAVKPGEWAHWTVNFDLDLRFAGDNSTDGQYRAGNLSLYHNGRRVAAIGPHNETVVSGNLPWIFDIQTKPTATFLGQAAPDWEAMIDNLRFRNQASDTPAIRQSMRNPANPSDQAGLVAFFSFDGEDPDTDPISSLRLNPSGDLNLARPDADNAPEVATRLLSRLDTRQFGSGFALNEISNYNPALYSRDAATGQWGPLFPVNDSVVNQEEDRKLDLVYYENPSRELSADQDLHPNVDWPWAALRYDDVRFPLYGPHRDKRIYIASRVGSEGVDRLGLPQAVFDPARYDELTLYNQADLQAPGYNPNEEHALIAPSNLARLTGADSPNITADAAFALQHEINRADRSDAATFTSEPWTLVQFIDRTTGEPDMAAYKVLPTRSGSLPFPRRDPVTHDFVDPFTASGPAFDLSYQFEYAGFAGDILIPPYPLNLVIGAVQTPDARGGNILVDGQQQRSLWRDVNRNPWIVSGDGRFFYQFVYPLRADFWFPEALPLSTPIAWLPGDGSFVKASPNDLLEPVKVRYSTFWRSGYPKLKRGETLTFQGGEWKQDNPAENGLPSIVGMAAAQVVYDSRTPSMVIDDTNRNAFSARVIRPLDRREVDVPQADMPETLQPAATEKVFVIAERWYFKDLPGALQNRLHYDSLRQKLVWRGRLNGRESGDPDLTAGPDPINILEPNIMSPDDYERVLALSSENAWQNAINSLYLLAQNPLSLADSGTPLGDLEDPEFLAGLQRPEPTPDPFVEAFTYWNEDPQNGTIEFAFRQDTVDGLYEPLNSFGAGSALIPNPESLLDPLPLSPEEKQYVTVVENNDSRLAGAPISLHIIELVPDRFRGAIAVIEPADAFSEKISLQHSGDFAANTANLEYQWFLREAGPLDVIANEVPTLVTDNPDPDWQLYQSGNGLHSIIFEGRPDIAIADQMFLARYRHLDEAASDGWKLVAFEPEPGDWEPATLQAGPEPAAPFQWAGAANSPQLQADGSKRYIPQLVMGWVKRILDRINPYEARFTDFFNNESPAVYSSMLQVAGAPYIGKVALNSNKNVIENTGLIELYETVLERARELTIDVGAATEGTNQALLLASTRLTILYQLLASEAYNDAQDPSVRVTAESGLQSVASHVHAFQNQEASLLHEELALLRGTDFMKSYPVFNRMFWNYVKGLGEVAYNVNYAIYDENADGFINEDDARALFPQGHGDAWGHYLSAIDKHYELLRTNGFSWRARSELYALLQNVIEADYLDELSFARLAGERARAGRDIVQATYRLEYTADPDGQWQGYTDLANPARAWGVSEWAQRAGQGAWFDWAVANALLPESAGETLQDDFDDDSLAAENLDRIERRSARAEIGSLAATLMEIQHDIDAANSGRNPLGLTNGSMAFDMDPLLFDGGAGGRKTHFEQIHQRAVKAGHNALATLDFAAASENKLRKIAENTDTLIYEAFQHDLAFRNELIQIFGRPFDGTVGFGRLYPEGYAGPDILLYNYLTRTKVDQIIPRSASGSSSQRNFTTISAELQTHLANDDTLLNLYKGVYGQSNGDARLADATRTFVTGLDFEDVTVNFRVPVERASRYAFQADPTWGDRPAFGQLQTLLGEMLLEEMALEETLAEYSGFLGDVEVVMRRIIDELDRQDFRAGFNNAIVATRATINTTRTALGATASALEIGAGLAKDVAEAGSEAVPKVIGFSTDGLSAVRGALKVTGLSLNQGLTISAKAVEETSNALELVRDEVIASQEAEIARLDRLSELEGHLAEFEFLAGNEAPLRTRIGQHLQNLELKRQAYFSALNRGFALLEEREGFNTTLAATVQGNRYRDMLFRIGRTEALSNYQAAFEHAGRYAWLAAKAYEYETSLDPGAPAAVTSLLDDIVSTRNLGLWDSGAPRSGQGGLGEILARMEANFQVLKGQLGLNNPQKETGKLSLRRELFRIERDTFAGDTRWRQALQARRVDDLWQMPEFVQYCRPFATRADGPQPGLVIPFSTEIFAGRNVFGRGLGGEDHAYSSANFSTKIRSVGVWLEDYLEAGLSTSPRVYLVPAGRDYLRLSNSLEPVIRGWDVVEERIPTPFILNESELTQPGFLFTSTGIDGLPGEIRRFGDFRAYHDSGGSTIDDSHLIRDSRLIGRSVWNSRWLLIIPGASLRADPDQGLDLLISEIDDIKLHFETYSQSGQ